MKITAEHYAHMRDAIQPLTPRLIAHRAALAQNPSVKNIDMRLRWDALRAAGLMPFLCDTLYTYLNDTHVDTALHSIIKQLEVQ